ncbi:hypothetical protein ACFSTC_08975 [Nonomuraea ferruginea]
MQVADLVRMQRESGHAVEVATATRGSRSTGCTASPPGCRSTCRSTRAG